MIKLGQKNVRVQKHLFESTDRCFNGGDNVVYSGITQHVMLLLTESLTNGT